MEVPAPNQLLREGAGDTASTRVSLTIPEARYSCSGVPGSEAGWGTGDQEEEIISPSVPVFPLFSAPGSSCPHLALRPACQRCPAGLNSFPLSTLSLSVSVPLLVSRSRFCHAFSCIFSLSPYTDAHTRARTHVCTHAQHSKCKVSEEEMDRRCSDPQQSKAKGKHPIISFRLRIWKLSYQQP